MNEAANKTVAASSHGLGEFGVFRNVHRLSPDLAAEVETLGYGALWLGGSPDGDLRQIEDVLDATKAVPVATGVVNIWNNDPQTVSASYHRIEAKHPGRLLVGIGVGNPERIGKQYQRPYGALVSYFDALDEAGVPVKRRLLGALGPRVLKLSADRSLGAHPYLVPPEHTRRAREILGAEALLAPEQHVVLESDPDRARAIARPVVETPYLGLTNYVNNLRSLGFGDDDLGEGVASDRLLDAVVVHGDLSAVVAGLRAHLDAGANHVAVNLLTGPDDDLSAGIGQLAAALFG